MSKISFINHICCFIAYFIPYFHFGNNLMSKNSQALLQQPSCMTFITDPLPSIERNRKNSCCPGNTCNHWEYRLRYRRGYIVQQVRTKLYKQKHLSVSERCFFYFRVNSALLSEKPLLFPIVSRSILLKSTLLPSLLSFGSNFLITKENLLIMPEIRLYTGVPSV